MLQGTEDVEEDPDDSTLRLKWRAKVGTLYQRPIDRIKQKQKQKKHMQSRLQRTYLKESNIRLKSTEVPSNNRLWILW